jgi:predicted dithiol-disulfide oxidoreductase (DUF899 family)
MKQMRQAMSQKPVAELAKTNRVRHPNESAEYRRARQSLLIEEIELRRHIERVAQMRRALPPGGEVTKAYAFEGEHGRVTFPELFGDKQTLVVYSYMFGPQRDQPCPMCTSFMSTWEAKLADVEQRIALVFVARSPIARLVAAKKAGGWTRHTILSDASGDYTRDYVSAEDADVPGTASSRGATARSAISGRARWEWGPPIPARIREARRILTRSGRFWIRHRKAAARTGIRS